MSYFWTYARRLLDRPTTLALAVTMAFLSAAGLGAGLLAMPPVLRLFLYDDPNASLQSVAQERVPWLGEAIVQELPTDRFMSIVWLVAGLILLTLYGATANFLHAALAYRLTIRTVGDVRRHMFRHALHLPLKNIVGRSNEVVSRLMNDTEVLLGGYFALLSKIPADILKGLIAVIVAIVLDWRLALTALLVSPVLYVVIRKLGKRIRRASRGALQARSEVLGAATEAVQGIRVVKVYSSERRELARFTKHNDDAVREQSRTYVIRALGSPLVEVITISFLGIVVIVASKAIIDGRIETEIFLSTLAALALAGAALKPLTRAVQEIQTAEAAAKRISELLNEPPEPMWTTRIAKGRRPRLPRHAESIEFDSIRFTYPNAETPALDGISVDIPHGATVAFVGPNGCGKTTLLSLVPLLFEPDSGCVRIDGRDIADVDLRSLRRQISVVTQETVIFGGSIRDNIAYGRRSAAEPPTDEQVIDAAKRARAHEFIERLPDGYDTILGEHGSTLSGGQRQRLAIARAILRDPAILILDEATSMIDADSEHKIADAIAEFSTGRTCLIVAHRLSTVVNADRIVVMDQGRIVQSGDHDELLRSSDLYQSLARTQLVAATT